MTLKSVSTGDLPNTYMGREKNCPSKGDMLKSSVTFSDRNSTKRQYLWQSTIQKGSSSTTWVTAIRHRPLKR